MLIDAPPQFVSAIVVYVIWSILCLLREFDATYWTYSADRLISRAIHDFKVSLAQRKQVLNCQQVLISRDELIEKNYIGQTCALWHDAKKCLNLMNIAQIVMRHCSA